jgi:hypothetical protein
MVIEYIGEVIRTELSELREKLYEARVSHIHNGQCGTRCCCLSLKFIDWCTGALSGIVVKALRLIPAVCRLDSR